MSAAFRQISAAEAPALIGFAGLIPRLQDIDLLPDSLLPAEARARAVAALQLVLDGITLQTFYGERRGITPGQET